MVIGAEEPDRQKDAGGEDLHGDGRRSPVRDTEAEVHPADAGELGAEVDMRTASGRRAANATAARPAPSPAAMPRLFPPSEPRVSAAATVIAA